MGKEILSLMPRGTTELYKLDRVTDSLAEEEEGRGPKEPPRDCPSGPDGWLPRSWRLAIIGRGGMFSPM